MTNGFAVSLEIGVAVSVAGRFADSLETGVAVSMATRFPVSMTTRVSVSTNWFLEKWLIKSWGF